MRFILFCCVFIFFNCSPREGGDNQLTVTVEKLALRAAPGVRGAEIATLRAGDALIDLGEVSSFESTIAFGDAAERMPWLKVKTADSQEGWVYAGAVKPGVQRDNWLQQKRLEGYFGRAFTLRLNTCAEGMSSFNTDGQCAVAFRNAVALRDSMIFLLERRPEPTGRPDYHWLSDVLPGFVYQQVKAGGPPDLFADYGFWRQKAGATTGVADDAFFETCFMVFPNDSIESFFPVWKFQLSELESASQLGTGMHLKVLQQIDKTLEQSRLFQPELMRFKDAVIEDIQDKNTRFWQSKELILKELDQMIAEKPACLSAAESSALYPRRVMLEDPEKNGVKVNLRSGE